MKVVAFLFTWLVVWFIPVFALATLGIPIHGTLFWFREGAWVLSIAWAWISLFLSIYAAVKEGSKE